MKKWKVAVGLCMCALFTFSASALAAPLSPEAMAKLLGRMQGIWYSENSTTEYEFKDGFIDKDKVLSIDMGTEGENTFGCRIYCLDSADNEQFSYNIAFQNLQDSAGDAAKSAYHESMTMVKSGKVFHRTKELQYFESIGGLYLEMPEQKVVEMYGAPEAAVNEADKKVLKYTKLGLSIDTENGRISSITIYNWGDRAFDKSRLTAKSMPAEFAQKYNAKEELTGDGVIDTGYNEYIHVLPSKNCVTLSLYNR